MFGQRKPCVQVVKGRTRDAAALKEAAERWHREAAPGARGWLGTTGGVTDDGVFFNLTRFVSERAARRNDRRREQVWWWNRLQELSGGDVDVHECTDVETFGRRGTYRTGFVQILETRVRDREAVRPFVPEEAQETLNRLRPDMIGGMFCVRPDGFVTGVAYFTSRDAAREGERMQMPPDYKAWRDEQMTHFDEDAEFYDLRDFWLQSPD
ncbi:hypothetical protein D0T12_22665 [Actinomadura spongiicola]|uniref:Antibiotic biosynthesis monooxygenase n=1 Tax=Actinomadura spongiicola TaxID=2303421 RepID=A0A372GD55_9ACTN|nr:hypothetical protein [Actinomadura spongiicola]RFS83003.1 hypothetical protein D0T12_22665 [Actinomadura spongiicola]